jgi:hypothetical protein
MRPGVTIVFAPFDSAHTTADKHSYLMETLARGTDKFSQARGMLASNFV